LLQRVTPLARQINCLELERIAEVCITRIPELFGARFASLYILDETNNMLHLRRHNHPFLINRIVSLNQTPASPMVTAVRCGQILLVDDIDKYNKPVIKKSQRRFAENYSTKNCAIVPLVCQERVVGVLNLADKMNGSRFTKDDVALLELLSQLIGASIGNIKLFERIQRQATTDGLTGLLNHRTFYEVLEKELWRSRRYGGRLSLIMIDVDNLKQVNDTFGHRAGDTVLREISRRIKSCIRQIDTAARYGGDEFAVILPNTSLNDAKVVAERMLKAVSSRPAVWNNREIALSISVGVGQCETDISPEDVTSRSDAALYQAKQAGKNTVRVFEPTAA